MSWPPPHAKLLVEGTVIGEAATAGSKTSGVAYRKDASGKSVPVTYRGKDGRDHIRTFTKDSSGKKGQTWRSDVRDALGALLGPEHELVDDPLVLEVCFFRVRPKTHLSASGAVKESGPAFPTTRPDGTKLLRAFEDALTKVVWTDDSRIVSCRWDKRFAPAGGGACAMFSLWTLPRTMGALRLAEHNQEQETLV